MVFPVLNSPKKCVICGGEIKKGRRYDTIYCAPKCKQKAYAKRLRDNADNSR